MQRKARVTPQPRRRSPRHFSSGACLGLLLFVAQQAHAQRRHVVVDTDVGPDDLLAIAFLLRRPGVHVDAVVVETGLTHVAQGADNVLRLLHLLGADDVPVFLGAARHLQPTSPFPASWIAITEQRGASAAPPALRRPESRDATAYLAGVLTSGRTAREILAIGPLTNIALALRRATPRRVRRLRIVIMGGAIAVPGNLVTSDSRSGNARAEWNIFSDPIAARDVFASPLRVELVALDATRHVPIDTAFLRALQAPGTAAQRYAAALMNGMRPYIERGEYYAWDPLAAVALVDPRVAEWSSMPLTVDLEPPFTGWTHRAPGAPRVSVALSADRALFTRSFQRALAAQ